MLQKISPRKITSPLSLTSNSHGVSLIEILVVLFIMAGLTSVFLPRLGGKQEYSTQILRRLANVSKEAHDAARLSHSTYRLVLDLRPNDRHQYWVERAQGQVLLRTQEQLEDLERLTQLQRDAILKKEEFQADTRITKEPIELPSELKIAEVEISGREAPFKEGRVYIHYQPRGLVDEAVIRIQREEQLKWSIMIHPLTGRGQVVDYFVYLKDLHQ